MRRLLLLALSFGVVAASDFSLVYEWDEKMKLDLPLGVKHKPRNVVPDAIAVFGDRLFMSLHDDDDVPITLAWLPLDANATPSMPPKPAPYPSFEMNERGNCNSMQNVSGLEVDTVGRLWALDRGSAECPARLWIFDLSDDSLVLEYEFPVGYSVTRNYLRRSLTSLVLDETPDAWFAYIADDAYLIVFTVQFENNDSWAVRWNDSWSVSMNGGYVFSLGLQPKENRRWLYLGDSYSDSLFALPVDELRREELDLTATEVGDKTAPTFRMLMDNQGKLFFDSRGQNQVAVWDSNEMELDDYEIYFESPELFQERYLQEDYWHKFSFAIDDGNFWLLEKSNVQVQNEKDGKRKWKNFYQLHKAVTGTKSYLH